MSVNESSTPETPDPVQPERDAASWRAGVVRDHAALLLRYARSITEDVELARDAVQDTFVRLCRERPEAIAHKLLPWLLCVCRSRVVDLARRRRRGGFVAEAEGLPEAVDGQPWPSERAQRGDDWREVMDVVARLPRRQREVVRLKFQNGLSYKEIAEVTGMSVANVGVTLHTALITLKQQLRPERSPAGPPPPPP